MHNEKEVQKGRANYQLIKYTALLLKIFINNEEYISVGGRDCCNRRDTKKINSNKEGDS